MHSNIELSSIPAEAQQHLSASLSAAVPQAAQQHRKQISSRSLLEDQREVEIEHSGQIYRLRVTALGKLILTK